MKIVRLRIASWWIFGSQVGNVLAAQQGLRGGNESNATLVASEEALRVQSVHQRRDASTTLSDRLRHTSRVRWLVTLGKRHYHLVKRDTNACLEVGEDSKTSVPCDDSDWVASADELDHSREVVQLDESKSGLADESGEPYSSTDEEVVDEEDIDERSAQDDLGDDEVEEIRERKKRAEQDKRGEKKLRTTTARRGRTNRRTTPPGHQLAVVERKATTKNKRTTAARRTTVDRQKTIAPRATTKSRSPRIRTNTRARTDGVRNPTTTPRRTTTTSRRPTTTTPRRTTTTSRRPTTTSSRRPTTTSSRRPTTTSSRPPSTAPTTTKRATTPSSTIKSKSTTPSTTRSETTITKPVVTTTSSSHPKTTSTTLSTSTFSKSPTSTSTTTSALPVFTQGAGDSSSGTNPTLPGPVKVTLNCTTIISFVNNTTPVSNATLATNGTAMNGTDVNPVGANVTVCVPITNTTTNATIPPVVVPRYPCNWTNKVPSGFDGTVAGFAMTCNLRYCDPDERYVDTIWGGTDGNVTRLEIESALGLLAKIPPVLANGIGNVLANGYLGEACRAAGQMYQVTGDRRALDLTLQMAENMHFLQNDPVNGTVMWTGLRDPVWPTGPPTPNSKANLQYAGSENGYIVANMILPALYILKQPCLWDMTPTRVGGWKGPSKFDDNVTYLDRARGLIAAGRRTYDAYFLPWFFDKTGNVIQPNDPRWSQVGDAGSTNGAGMPMAFNRRALLLDGMSKLASAYEHPMLFNPAVTASYDQLIKVNLGTFVNDMEPTRTLNGALPSYDWDYVVGRNNTEEVRGIHGWFDVYWFFMAWQRNADYYNMTTSLMSSLANTMQYTIYQGNNTFSAYVDGHSTAADPAVSVLSGGWAYYAYWLPGWFGTVASANSVNFMKVPMYSIPLIWIKNAIATNNWLTGVETMSDRTIILPLPFPRPTGTSTTALPTFTTSTSSTSSKPSTSTTSTST